MPSGRLQTCAEPTPTVYCCTRWKTKLHIEKRDRLSGYCRIPPRFRSDCANCSSFCMVLQASKIHAASCSRVDLSVHLNVGGVHEVASQFAVDVAQSCGPCTQGPLIGSLIGKHQAFLSTLTGTASRSPSHFFIKPFCESSIACSKRSSPIPVTHARFSWARSLCAGICISISCVANGNIVVQPADTISARNEART